MVENLQIYKDASELIKRVFIIVKPFSIYIRNSTKQRAKFATEPQSINSYYGMMRHINCYNLRKSIALRNNLNMLKYEKLA